MLLTVQNDYCYCEVHCADETAVLHLKEDTDSRVLFHCVGTFTEMKEKLLRSAHTPFRIHVEKVKVDIKQMCVISIIYVTLFPCRLP